MKTCHNCTKPVYKNTSRCLEHLKKRYEYEGSRKCKSCHRKAETGKITCALHGKLNRDKSNQTRKQRKQKKLCYFCGKRKVSGGFKACEPCREYKREKRRSGWLNSRCYGCDKPVAVRHMCLDHWFTMIARMNLNDPTRGPDIKDLFARQKSVCPYTGRYLIPGKTASLDHRKPRSAGGGDEISNLQWIHIDVNYAKRRMSEAAFYELCNSVTDHLRNRLAIR